MSYGGIDFEHVWAYQIKCMMANQYDRLIEAIAKNDPDLIIAVCLRLGWNDAFKHVSENVGDAKMLNFCNAKNWIGTVFSKRQNKFNTIKKLNDEEKDNLIFEICKTLVPDFKCYAKCSNTASREAKLKALVSDPTFTAKFEAYKLTNSKKYPLCEGHIQKMFNMAIKLLLCLVMSAEFAETNRLTVRLGKDSNGNFVNLTGKDWWKHIFNEETFDADCPLDSKILDKIQEKRVAPNHIIPSLKKNNFTNIVWSKLGKGEALANYSVAQNEIRQIYSGTGKCNLCFDFENWN